MHTVKNIICSVLHNTSRVCTQLATIRRDQFTYSCAFTAAANCDYYGIVRGGTLFRQTSPCLQTLHPPPLAEGRRSIQTVYPRERGMPKGFILQKYLYC